MNETFFQPSLSVDSLLSGDLAQDSERFLLFLKAYYEWLQTTTITLESVSGTFVRDEEVVGENGATATIKQVSTNTLVVKTTTKKPFNLTETLTGQTSNATATIKVVKDNVVRKTGKILDYRNIEYSVDKYIEYLKDELFTSIPMTMYSDKRLVALKFKDFFESKSNEDSYKFLFKLLYNEDINLYYPGEDLLRVSDGDFEKTQIVRAVVTDDVFDFLNKTINGGTSNALGNVVDIKRYVIGSIEVAEMTLKLVSGTFLGGESITDITDETLTTTLYGMVTGFTINDAGSGYQVGDAIAFAGDGSAVEAVVSSIQQSPITAINYNTTGHGYRVGTNASVINSGTGGSGLIVRVTEIANTYTVTSGANTYTVGEASRVQIINRGSNYYKKPTITLVDDVIQSIGMLSENLITIVSGGSNYGVGNTITFTGGSGANATGIVASVTEATSYNLLFEDGDKVIGETGKDVVKNEEWVPIGPIARVELTNFGTGYTNSTLPTSVVVSSTTGSSANLVVTGIQGTSANVTIDEVNNITGIGSIRAIEIKNFGVNYTSANANLTAIGDGNANVSVTVSGLGVKEGNWVTDDGKIDYKKIQDSYYYQDFSYVIRSGLVFTKYRDTIKNIIHPAGLQAFGEILIQTVLDVSPVISSAVESLINVNEYILYILEEFNVEPSIAQSRYARIIRSVANTSSTLLSNREVQVHIAPTKLESASSFTRTFEVRRETIFDTSHDIAVRQYKLEVPAIEFAAYATQYGDLIIGDYANTLISAFSAFSFDSFFTSDPKTSSEYVKNVKITGTVTFSGNTVIGTGTNFSSNFSVNDSFIVNNEKFIVKSVANSTYLQVNVNPIGSYTNVSAYKQEAA